MDTITLNDEKQFNEVSITLNKIKILSNQFYNKDYINDTLPTIEYKYKPKTPLDYYNFFMRRKSESGFLNVNYEEHTLFFLDSYLSYLEKFSDENKNDILNEE